VLVLASASPRRRALLAQAGLAFHVRPTDVDESLAGTPAPREAALELARRKALSAYALQARDARWILAADTVVGLPGAEGRPWTLLGKPADAEEAARMLTALAGTRHVVATGLCVLRASDGVRAQAAEETVVRMRPLAPAEVQDYVARGEWRDKAGGYAIQESADRFVTSLEGGGFDNVVGLPVALALGLLAGLGCPAAVAARCPNR
jgi:septum formation protein